MLKVKTAHGYLIRENNGKMEICLKKKKSGNEKEIWDGVAGKFDPDNDRTLDEVLLREAYDKLGVELSEYEEIGKIRFRDQNKIDDRHIFIIRDWSGEPTDSSDTSSNWFDADSLPLDEMTEDDELWVPELLRYQRKFMAEFVTAGDSVDWSESWIDWVEDEL